MVQPASVTVTAGQPATFSVLASGTAPISYQWRKNTANISGATAASYTTPATTTADSGSKFDVVVMNNSGSITSSQATLTVNCRARRACDYHLSLRIKPSFAGQTATFSVVAVALRRFLINGARTPPTSAARLLPVTPRRRPPPPTTGRSSTWWSATLRQHHERASDAHCELRARRLQRSPRSPPIKPSMLDRPLHLASSPAAPRRFLTNGAKTPRTLTVRLVRATPRRRPPPPTTGRSSTCGQQHCGQHHERASDAHGECRARRSNDLHAARQSNRQCWTDRYI